MRMYARNKTATIIGGIVIGIITLGALLFLGAVIYGTVAYKSIISASYGAYWKRN